MDLLLGKKKKRAKHYVCTPSNKNIIRRNVSSIKHITGHLLLKQSIIKQNNGTEWKI